MSVSIRIRRGTTAQWNASTNVLAAGEIGLDTSLSKLKVGNGSSLWQSLPYLSVAPSELLNLTQSYIADTVMDGTGLDKSFDSQTGKLTLSVDSTVANKSYVDTAVSSLSNTADNSYVSVNLLGNVDGVATLDENGFVPNSQISDTITRDVELSSAISTEVTNRNIAISTAINNLVDGAPAALDTLNELAAAINDDSSYASTITTALATKITATSQDTLKNKTISISNGITSASAYDSITGFYGQNNIVVNQDGLDKGGKINISAIGVISVATSGSGYYSGLAIIGGGTRIVIEIGGNTLTGTTAQFNAALTDNDFATLAGFETLTNKTITSPLGLVKADVGLANVDNTSDVNKPVSSAMATALAAKANNVISINAQSASYTLAAADSGKLVEMSGGGTLTIPSDAEYNFAIGTSIEILQTGTSQVTIAGSGFTPNSTPGLKLRAQWSSASLVKRGSNSWVVLGDLAV